MTALTKTRLLFENQPQENETRRNGAAGYADSSETDAESREIVSIFGRALALLGMGTIDFVRTSTLSVMR